MHISWSFAGLYIGLTLMEVYFLIAISIKGKLLMKTIPPIEVRKLSVSWQEAEKPEVDLLIIVSTQ